MFVNATLRILFNNSKIPSPRARPAEGTLEEAVTTANRSRFGNTATVYTTSGKAAHDFSEHIEAGMVGVNIGVPAPVAWFPFAGWKDSFYGDLHATGMDGFLFYTERRVITARW